MLLSTETTNSWLSMSHLRCSFCGGRPPGDCVVVVIIILVRRSVHWSSCKGTTAVGVTQHMDGSESLVSLSWDDYISLDPAAS
jgi:hypothetical protein